MIKTLVRCSVSVKSFIPNTHHFSSVYTLEAACSLPFLSKGYLYRCFLIWLISNTKAIENHFKTDKTRRRQTLHPIPVRCPVCDRNPDLRTRPNPPAAKRSAIFSQSPYPCGKVYTARLPSLFRVAGRYRTSVSPDHPHVRFPMCILPLSQTTPERRSDRAQHLGRKNRK